jgi:predicted nucleic acid-binding protein
MKAAATKRLVLDASVALAWCFEDESNAYSELILDVAGAGGEFRVPAIWPFEVANALLAAERRKRITTAQVTALLQRIGKLAIVVEPISTDHAFSRIISVARHLQLTEYDAAYLELALRESLPMATLDAKLRRAAHSAGIELLE